MYITHLLQLTEKQKIVHEYVVLGNLIFILFWNYRLAVYLPSKDNFYDVNFQQFLKSIFTLPELCCILKPIFNYVILKNGEVVLKECIDMPHLNHSFLQFCMVSETHRPVYT